MFRVFFFSLLLLAPFLHAKEKQPLWELGVGAGSYMSPHYLGANQSAIYTLPLPFIIYRGERVRADKGGLFSQIIGSDAVDLHVSLGGSLPVNSEDNDARQGMEDLDLMLEVGPTLQVKLYRSHLGKWRLDVPLRSVFSLGESVNYRGLIFNPRIHYVFNVSDWRFTQTLGPVFSSEHFHDYIYQVDQPYVTAERHEYNAKSGYTGLRYSFGVSKHFGDIFLGSFLNYYNLDHAKNEKSPLMKTDDYVALSFAVSWVFAKSSRLVEL